MLAESEMNVCRMVSFFGAVYRKRILKEITSKNKVLKFKRDMQSLFNVRLNGGGRTRGVKVLYLEVMLSKDGSGKGKVKIMQRSRVRNAMKALANR